MRRSYVALALGLIVLTSSVALAVRSAGETPAATQVASVTHEVVESFDGTPIAITVFRPTGASDTQPVPVVLNSHGWSGSRAKTVAGLVEALVKEGYGVVSFDARGHGESGGVATVHNREYETKDTLALLDWIHGNLSWVQKQTDTGIDKDVLAGATGGSYGGAYQLMAASVDARLDALVPEITWNDLTYSLASNGVIKSVWVDALYGAAKASGTRVHPDIDRWFREVQVTNAIPQDAYDHFKASSPAPADIRADVLLVQGIPDLLFNLNEAMRNYDALELAYAGDVRLVTHLSGHVLPGLQPMALHEDRPGNLHPCGKPADLALLWFEEHLKGVVGAADAIAEASFALDDGTCLARASAAPDGEANASFGALVAPQAAGSLLVPVLEGPAVVAGIPRIEATTTTLVEGIAQLGLVKGGPHGVRVVNDQSTGVRLAPGAPLEVELAGVATRLAEGETLYLRIDGLNEWYAHNGGRVPGAVLLTDVTVTLPLLDA